MALIKSPLFDGLWGKIGDLEFRMRKNKKIELAKKRIPMNCRSEAQLKQRERYKNCLQQYYKLTPEQLKQYEEIGRKQKLDAFRAFMAECLKAPIRLAFDNDGGGTWNRYINIPLTAAPAEYAQYKISLNGDTISVYSADGTLKTQGTGMTDFWNNVKTDGADIRAFDNNKNQLYFYIETFDYANQQAVIWVRVEANITELNIAYGNPTAMKSTYENGSMVFDFFDDFSTDITDWVIQQGTWNWDSANGWISNPGNAGRIHKSLSDSFSAVAYEADIQVTGIGDWNWAGIRIKYDTANKNSYWILIYGSGGVNGDSGNAVKIFREDAGTLTLLKVVTYTVQSNVWHKLKVIYNNGNIKVYLDGNYVAEATDTTYPRGDAFGLVANNAGFTSYFDNVRVYKIADLADFGTPTTVIIK